jgi:hypothetical protein
VRQTISLSSAVVVLQGIFFEVIHRANVGGKFAAGAEGAEETRL